MSGQVVRLSDYERKPRVPEERLPSPASIFVLPVIVTRPPPSPPCDIPWWDTGDCTP